MIRSWIFQEVWVVNLACSSAKKARWNRAFGGMVFKVKRWEGVYTFGVYDCVCSEAATMRHLMPWRTERGRYFHAHPQQAMFSLIASMLLAGLVVLALALSAR